MGGPAAAGGGIAIVRLITLKGWAFIPGPLVISAAPEDSTNLQEVAEYSPGEIAKTFLAFPGLRLMHPPEPTWWQWKAQWQQDQRSIAVSMALFETEPESWGGSVLDGRCLLVDIMELWAYL